MFGSWAPTLKKSYLLDSRRITNEKSSQQFLSSTRLKALLVQDHTRVKSHLVFEFSLWKSSIDLRSARYKSRFYSWTTSVKPQFCSEDSQFKTPLWFKIVMFEIFIWLRDNCSKLCLLFGLESNHFKPKLIGYLKVSLKLHFLV